MPADLADHVAATAAGYERIQIGPRRHQGLGGVSRPRRKGVPGRDCGLVGIASPTCEALACPPLSKERPATR